MNNVLSIRQLEKIKVGYMLGDTVEEIADFAECSEEEVSIFLSRWINQGTY